ncbi:MAG: hypothetical protein SF053_01620 [Bacteroidia bacterium]|nr:hypothetical protein [Bacteroidia bacterium]
MNTEPVVHRLRRLLKEKNISHASLAEKIGKHRTFVTRKLGGDSMETRLLEQLMEAADITWEALICGTAAEADLRQEMEALWREVNQIKERLPEYKTKQDL